MILRATPPPSREIRPTLHSGWVDVGPKTVDAERGIPDSRSAIRHLASSTGPAGDVFYINQPKLPHSCSLSLSADRPSLLSLQLSIGGTIVHHRSLPSHIAPLRLPFLHYIYSSIVDPPWPPRLTPSSKVPRFLPLFRRPSPMVDRHSTGAIQNGKADVQCARQLPIGNPQCATDQ